MERTKQGEFAWTDLSARDLDAQTAFYEGLFGWHHTDVPFSGGQIYRMFDLDGRTVAGASRLSPEMIAAGVPSAWNVYVAVDDVDAMHSKAMDLGAIEAMPAMDVAGRGRFSAIVDPTGASIFLWHATTPDPAQTYSDPGALLWTDLTTRDPAKAMEFFAELMDWDIRELDQGPGRYWQIYIDGEGEGGIMPMPEMVPPQVPAYWLDYFATEDVAVSVAKAKSLGAVVTVEPTKVGEMLTFAVMDDPGGATFALLQPIGPG